jgi:hypothetical protein
LESDLESTISNLFLLDLTKYYKTPFI